MRTLIERVSPDTNRAIAQSTVSTKPALAAVITAVTNAPPQVYQFLWQERESASRPYPKGMQELNHLHDVTPTLRTSTGLG